jgi:cell division protein ZapA
MMAQATKQIDFKVMGREFRVACPENEERQLLEAVAYVDRRMVEMRDKSKVIGLERIAIMTALAIANELLHTKIPGGFDVAEFKRRMNLMQTTIDTAIAEQEKLF